MRQNGDLTGAVACFENALKIDPELREGYYGLGLALKQQGAHARSPLSTNERPASDPYTRAQQAAARGDLNAAKDQLIEAVRVNDGDGEAHNLLGFIQGQTGDLESAVNHLQRAVPLLPESSEAHYNLGVALQGQGRFEDVLACYDKAIALKGDLVDAHWNRAYVMLTLGRYADAMAFPLIPCRLCGSQDNMQRVAVKKMLAGWEREFPGRTESIASALRHVELEHLADPRHVDFARLEMRRAAARNEREEEELADTLGALP